MFLLLKKYRRQIYTLHNLRRYYASHTFRQLLFTIFQILMDFSVQMCSPQIDSQSGEEGVGEISVQIDLFTHPGTGEHKVTVKGKLKLIL